MPHIAFATEDYAEGGVIAGTTSPFFSDFILFLMIAIVAANVGIGFFQEYRAERTMESLRKLSSPTATVIRTHSGVSNVVSIPTSDITIGDPRVAATHAMGMSPSSLNVVFTAGGMIAAINSILAGIGIALILRGAGLVIAIAASCGAITALVIYGLHLRWALSRYAAGLAVPSGNTAG